MSTVRMRSKVDAIDYKYFVEPNIPRFKIEESWVEEIKKSIPELPYERKAKYVSSFGITEYDARIIIKDIDYANYFEECVRLGADAKNAANWFSSQVLGYIYKKDIAITETFMTPERLAFIIKNINDGTISSKQGKELFNLVLEREEEPSKIMEAEGMKQMSDDSVLLDIITKILDNSPSQIEAYKNGKTNLLGFFVGQVMKETKGTANPGLVNKLLMEEINKR